MPKKEPDWKAKLKRQQSKSKKIRIEASSSLGGSFDTGLGPDGKLQPDRATHLIGTNQGPKTVHEGERVNPTGGPNGQLQVIPASMLGGQQQLQGIPGYADGLYEDRDMTPDLTPRVSAGMPSLNDNVSASATPVSSLPSISAGMPDLNDANPNIRATPATGQSDMLALTGAQSKGDSMIANMPSTLLPSGMPALNDATPQINATGVTDGTGLSGAKPFNEVQAANQPAPPPAGQPLGEDYYRQLAMTQLGKAARGDSDVNRTIANRALGDLGATQQAQATGLGQELAQLGTNKGLVRSGMAQQARGFGMDQAQLAGQLAQGSQERALGATRDLASAALQGKQFANKVDQQNYDSLIASGDYDGAADFAEQNLGFRPDMTRLKKTAELADKTANYTLRGLTGTALADIYELNPDTWWGEDDLSGNAMREHWDSYFPDRAGDYGADFANWANEQEAILKDPANRTETGALKRELAADVAAGNITQEDMDAVLEYFNAVRSGRIDENGNIKPLQSTWDKWSDDEKFASFDKTQATATGETLTKEQWVEAGKPQTYSASIAPEPSLWTDNENENAPVFESEFITSRYANDPTTGLPRTDGTLDDTGVSKGLGEDVSVKYTNSLYSQWRTEQPNAPRTYDDYKAWYLGYDNMAAYTAGQSGAGIGGANLDGITATSRLPSDMRSDNLTTFKVLRNDRTTNWDINEAVYSDVFGNFNDEFSTWANESKGQIVDINGGKYLIHATNPIVDVSYSRAEYRETNSTTPRFEASHDIQALWAKNMATGKWEPLVFGSGMHEIDTGVRIVKATSETITIPEVKDNAGEVIIPATTHVVYDSRS